jgi:hypothetical protein
MAMPRITPIKRPAPIRRSPADSLHYPVQRIKEIAKGIPFAVGPAGLGLFLLLGMSGNSGTGGYFLLGIPALLIGCILLYQLQRLTWYGDCRPEDSFSDPAAIIQGILFAGLGASMMYQATWALELVVYMKTEWYLSSSLKNYVIGVSFVQGLIIFIWMGLKLNRVQYFVAVLGFFLMGHLLLGLCWPLSYGNGFYPYITPPAELAMVGVYGLVALVGFFAWGLAPLLYLNAFRLHRRKVRQESLNIE